MRYMLMAAFWVVTLCGLAMVSNASDKHTTSIFRAVHPSEALETTCYASWCHIPLAFLPPWTKHLKRLLQVTGNPVVGKPCAVNFGFKNPLKKVLTDCKFQYAGPGLVRNTPIPYRYTQGHSNWPGADRSAITVDSCETKPYTHQSGHD
jgi:hypothetical protein